jgi:hypothetical protein
LPFAAPRKRRADAQRSLRLHLGGDVAIKGSVGAVRSRPTPPFVVRAAQRVAMKAGLLSYDRHALQPLLDLRRRALGPTASGPPRFLVRVDEFPYYRAYDEPEQFGLDASRKFHDILASAGVPQLVSVVPRLTHKPLDPETSGDVALGAGEVALLEEMKADGVTFAMHGYNHRTRYSNSRRRSELCGLSPGKLEDLIDRGLASLDELDIHPRVFVPPFNRFDASQYDILAKRFDVITGGPESVVLMGFHGTPLWRGDAVYAPCYPPLYGTAENCIPLIDQLAARQVGTWIPLVLHLGWEIHDWSKLERFAQAIGPYAASWEEFLAAVDASRETASLATGSSAA